MNTKQIEYILELAKTKNFNKAAENVFVSQPTMTYQINAAEEEIGFRIFDRSGKGASVTPAGEQFIATLKDINAQYKRAVEQGQNFSREFRDDIRISLPTRSSLFYLPEIMKLYAKIEPSVSITPYFDYYRSIDNFLRGEQDILFAMRETIRQLPDINTYPIFDSRIYLVCKKDDALANKTLITEKELEGRTLMIGGGSPIPLRSLQQKLIRNEKISYFNSNDHDTSITYLAADRAIVLSPGFLNDHNPDYAWIPFDTGAVIPCVLCTHSSDKRKSIIDLLTLIIDYYSKVENI